ncbi:butyrate kinase [Clostridium felsineum]|uniref:Probable butyrate kinase n=1 Tax=Clostridium felsineum TaxID=36839 RepID=A0A1S8L4D8_9CLOT|nr:butyrate kinase [Clostridium felsineum]MCR3760252.1 butyrate kinase [Clostridium felsineum]URZ00514.1 Butyrate kinase 2 [Clostridium felsineum]URZ06848.1 Butyrate kinase 2 [Clostridium felsineum]URZ11880.1 Butyrate kinase 2 [Clostridium felsineum]
MNFKLLVINPGSTSTKIAVFNNNEEILCETLRHSSKELEKYENVHEQFEFRKNAILEVLKNNNFHVKEIDAVVGRGGLLKPIVGGTYKVNKKMLEDLKIGVQGEHASNLGGIIANSIAEKLKISAYIVDPVVVDEMEDIARFSGIPELPRKSIFHALNQKAVGKRYANEIGKKYEDLNIIVAHMGGGVSVGAHKNGRIIDINNALDGEGAYSPERSGNVPSGDLVRLCFSGKYTKEEILKKITGKGGLVAYCGTNNALDIQNSILKGEKTFKLVYEGMGYQVSKDIGSAAAVLKGKVDSIILTGGIAYDNIITSFIKERVSFIAPITIYKGEDEMLALAEGTLRVLEGKEELKEYK